MSKTISLKIDDELFNNIKRVSNLFNVSSSEFIRNAVIKELSTNLQNKIKDTIKKASDLEVKEVNIKVKNIEPVKDIEQTTIEGEK